MTAIQEVRILLIKEQKIIDVNIIVSRIFIIPSLDLVKARNNCLI